MTHTSTATTVSAAPEAGEHELALLVLSRRLGSLKNRSASSNTTRICRILAHTAAVEVPQADGTVLPAISPALVERTWPVAPTALRRLGLTQPEVRDMAEEAVHHRGPFATLETHVVEAFFPRELWAVVEGLAWGGPGTSAQRISRGLREYSRIEVPGNRHRTAGPPSRSSIAGLREDARALLRTFVALSSEGHPSPGLVSWTAVPEIRMPAGGRAGVDTAAPRPELVRLALSRLDAEVAEQLGIRPGEDECEAIERMSPTGRMQTRAFRVLRNRAALILLVLTGGRVTAIADLKKSDFVADHQGVAPDFRHGPAIRLRPGKTHALDKVRWKPLPRAAAARIEAYLLLLERGFEPVAAAAARAKDRHDPRFATPPKDYPLLVSDRLRFRSWQSHGLRTFVTGILPRRSGYPGVRPLIPREDVGNDDLSPEVRQYVGYGPHAFRHLAEQLAERAGRIWNEENPPTGGAPQPEPGLYASALLDHSPAGDPMRNLYGDRGTEAAYETLSGRAIELIWELLTTDRGSRRRPDVAAISRQADQVRAVEAHLQLCQERVAQIQRRPRLPLPRKQPVEDPPAGLCVEELVRLVHSQNAALARSQELLHARVDLGERTLRELLGLAEASAQLRERRDVLVRHLVELVYEPTHWEPVPDSEPRGAERIELDLDALLSGETTIASAPALPEESAVRDWLTFAEFSEACEIRSRSRVTRWAEGSHLPRDERRRPWDADSAPIDDSLGLRFRRIWVPGIRKTFWPSEGARQRAAAMLRRWPETQGWARGAAPGERCLAELKLPEPFNSRRLGAGSNAASGQGGR